MLYGLSPVMSGGRLFFTNKDYCILPVKISFSRKSYIYNEL